MCSHSRRIPARALAAIMASLLLPLAASTSVSAADPIDSDQLFRPDHVIDVRITLPEEDWKTLCSQTRNMGALFSGGTMTSPFTYFKGAATIDGMQVESVGIRKKGFIGSLDSERPSLKINFKKFVDQHPVKGLDILTLNNNKQDTSLVSQFLTYKIFRDAGVHAPRISFAHVTVNGTPLGVYSHVESVRAPFLRRSFGEASVEPGNLYEGTLADFYPKSIDKVEAKTNKKDHDRSRIRELATVLAAEGELDMAKIEKLIDIDNFMRFWVTEGAVRFWDGYSGNQNNYFLYINPANNLGYFMPWGTDSSFSQNGGPFNRRGNSGPTAIYAQSMLSNRLYNTKGMPERYRASMKQLLDEVWNEDAIFAEMDRIETMLEPHLHSSQKRSDRAMDDVREFFLTRRDVILKELKDWPAEVPETPRKPMYNVALGEMKGAFKTTWTKDAPDDVAETGKVTANIQLDGKDVAFTKLGAAVQPFEFPRWGRRGGPDPPPMANIVISGIRESDGEQVNVTLTLDRSKLETESKDGFDVTGRYSEGRNQSPWGGRGGPNRSVNGTLRLTKTGIQDGDTIEGELELNIVEIRGGMFDRRNRERRSEERPRRPEPRVKTGLETALDANGDETLTSEELKNATAALKRLDANKDGKLSAEELIGAAK